MTMTADEWSAWRLDATINRTGLPVDMALVEAAIAIDTEHRTRLLARAAELTAVDNPNSRDQMLGWLRGELDDPGIETLRKADVRDLLTTDLDPHVREVLEIRSELSMSSVKKYAALMTATGADGRLCGAFQFNGAARTGRWAGRLVQPQNLPRGTIKPKHLATARDVVLTGDYEFASMMYPKIGDLLASCVRTAFAAPPGKKLVVADFSSIETVMIAWASECDPLLNVFRTGRDAYKDMAVRLFGVPYEAVTSAQRTYTKPIVLGCGYMLGARGMVAYAANYGVKMSEDDAAKAVAAYREGYPEVVRFWHELDGACRRAIENPGKAFKARRFVFKIDGEFLLLKLPSGRKLAYHAPEINPDGRYGPEITYMGTDTDKQWRRLNTHPGKLCENVIQAVARDLLVAALFNAAADPGLEVVGHVHDEILALADANDATALDRLLDCMRRMPDWAADAPVNAAGWSGDFYRKD